MPIDRFVLARPGTFYMVLREASHGSGSPRNRRSSEMSSRRKKNRRMFHDPSSGFHNVQVFNAGIEGFGCRRPKGVFSDALRKWARPTNTSKFRAEVLALKVRLISYSVKSRWPTSSLARSLATRPVLGSTGIRGQGSAWQRASLRKEAR